MTALGSYTAPQSRSTGASKAVGSDAAAAPFSDLKRMKAIVVPLMTSMKGYGRNHDGDDSG
jgi:hypothetical protein